MLGLTPSNLRYDRKDEGGGTSGTIDDQHQYQICTIDTYTVYLCFMHLSSLDFMGGLLRDGLLPGVRGGAVSRRGEGKVHEMARDAR